MDRMVRINQQLKEEISRILLRELSDPRLEMVTIMAVRTSRDLRSARVYYSVLGDSRQAQRAQEGLDRARGLIRRLISQSVNLRNTPEFTFFFDDSAEASVQMESTLNQLREEE